MIKTAIVAARRAGDIVRDGFDVRGSKVTYKSVDTVVTETDYQAERVILETLKETFPNHAYYSEEAGVSDWQSDYLWVIDPLDGTTNFSRGIPHCAIALCLLQQSKPLLAVVYQPLTNELFTAEASKGAFLNGQKLKTGRQEYLEQTVVVANRASNKMEKNRFTKIFAALSPEVRTIRLLGATAIDICYVASGKFDIAFSNGCYRYDCAASNLIAKEAGLQVTGFLGEPYDWSKDASDVLITNEMLQPPLIDILRHL